MAAGRTGQRNGNFRLDELVKKSVEPLNGFQFLNGIAEESFFCRAIVFDLLFTQVTEKVAKNVFTFAAFQNKPQIIFADLLAY